MGRFRGRTGKGKDIISKKKIPQKAKDDSAGTSRGSVQFPKLNMLVHCFL